ncbi:ryncolin-2 isoform X2 [Nematostella vectensis]|uniref:ryncolin-2 isoform X2 n=1 Tax=Nematostella vectensis TaxID=45351 RepID=UPI0013900544|nr:ryncolin-2 isoform X2 [Nematostella vectensis]
MKSLTFTATFVFLCLFRMAFSQSNDGTHSNYLATEHDKRSVTKLLKSVKVVDDFACVRECTRAEESCTSVNFYKDRDSNGKHLCELLTDDKKQCKGDTNLVKDDEVHFITVKQQPPLIQSEHLAHTSGIFPIALTPCHPLDVYCDLGTSGGGWTVIQRRVDGSVDFYRGWDEYKRGFGNKEGEFWLGLDNIHAMTSQRRYRVRFDLEDFGGNTRYAEYDDFRVGDEAAKYQLVSIGTYSGTAGDSLAYHRGGYFSTPDRDNDVKDSESCAVRFEGWGISLVKRRYHMVCPLKSTNPACLVIVFCFKNQNSYFSKI